jgi:hypothetical protein
MSKRKNLAIVIISTLASLLLVEVFASIASDLKHRSSKRIRVQSCSDPYERKATCIQDFDTISKMKFTTLGGYKPSPNTSGRGYSTNALGARENNKTFNADIADNLVVTGGSAAWGAGVDTARTFASRLNDHCISKKSCQVLNFGVGGYTTQQEINRYIVDILPVVKHRSWAMFSGWNDVYAGYRGSEFFDSPDLLDLLKLIHKSPPKGISLSRSQIDLINKLPPDPSPVHIFRPMQKILYNWRNREITPKTTSLAPEEAAKLIVTNVESASGIATAHGKRFVFILQPSIYSTQKSLTPYEDNIIRTNEWAYPGLSEYFGEVYTHLKKILPASAYKNNYHYYDADQAIAEEALTVFVDHVHFGDRGNRLIGEHLHRILIE